MKKLLLSLGTVSAIATPVALVIVCGNGDNTNPETPNKEFETNADSIKNEAELKMITLDSADGRTKVAKKLGVDKTKFVTEFTGIIMKYTWDTNNLKLTFINLYIGWVLFWNFENLYCFC